MIYESKDNQREMHTNTHNPTQSEGDTQSKRHIPGPNTSEARWSKKRKVETASARRRVCFPCGNLQQGAGEPNKIPKGEIQERAAAGLGPRRSLQRKLEGRPRL